MDDTGEQVERRLIFPEPAAAGRSGRTKRAQRLPQRSAVDRTYLATGETNHVEFGGWGPVLVLLNRREPKPRRRARTSVAVVRIIIRRRVEHVAAGLAPYVERAAAIALTNVVHERHFP